MQKWGGQVTLHYIIVINVFKEKKLQSLYKSQTQSKRWVFSRRLKTGSDVADLISWGSLFQTEATATTKARSPIVERRVAGMASEDDAAERRCLRPDTSATFLHRSPIWSKWGGRSPPPPVPTPMGGYMAVDVPR